MFSPALAGGATNFAKKIQGLAEDKTENPRTCRGQSREQNPYERLQENSNPSKLCSSKLLSLSQPSLLQKPWAAVLPPEGLQYKIRVSWGVPGIICNAVQPIPDILQELSTELPRLAQVPM